MSKTNREEPVRFFQPSADPEEVFRRLAPRQYWKDVVEALGASIELAHQHGPDRWGIRLATNDIMLKAGLHEVLRIGTWDLPFHLIVDRNTVPPQLRDHSGLWFSEDEDSYGNLGAKGLYRSNPGSEACNMPFEMVRYAYQELFNSHAEIIARAARKPKHPSTRSTHSAELVQFLAGELGRPLLRPVCPNCHAVIHATKPPRTIEQVAKMVRGG